MKKSKETSIKEEIKPKEKSNNTPFPFPFAKKTAQQPINAQETDEHNCSTCDNAACKCNKIMINLAESLDLAEQNGHSELFNILLTLLVTLKHLENHEEDLLKIMQVCQDVYKDLNPKEMGHTLN